jgi:hypothetical protein
VNNLISVSINLRANTITLTDRGKRYDVRLKATTDLKKYNLLQRFTKSNFEIVDLKGEVVSNVRYDLQTDKLTIRKGFETIEITSQDVVHPEFVYNDETYTIAEGLTGKIIIRKKGTGEIVAKGDSDFSTLKFYKYQPAIADILKELALSYCIKIIAWPLKAEV